MTATDDKSDLDKILPQQPPPQHPATTSTNPSTPSTSSHTNNSTKKNNRLSRLISLSRSPSSYDSGTAVRFFSAYAHTWVGLTPLWLMGEAITPGKKVGTKFKQGRKELVVAAEELRKSVAGGAGDVLVIVDAKLREVGLVGKDKAKDGEDGGDGEKDGKDKKESVKEMAERTAEVIKAAGENAILVVTSSLDKFLSPSSSSSTTSVSNTAKSKSKAAQESIQAHLASLASSPSVQRAMHTHSRDALLLLDRALTHPVVVTGVREFAQTRGIPHADALLRLASLGLARIIRAMPEEVREEVEEELESATGKNAAAGSGARKQKSGKDTDVEEISAFDLERSSTDAERAEAERVGRAAQDVPKPEVRSANSNADGGVQSNASSNSKDADPYAELKKKADCIVM